MFLIRHVPIAGAHRQYNRIFMNQTTCFSSQQRSDFIAARPIQWNKDTLHQHRPLLFPFPTFPSTKQTCQEILYQSLSETPRSLITRHP